MRSASRAQDWRSDNTYNVIQTPPGLVRVYVVADASFPFGLGTWVQMGDDIEGVELGSRFGQAVAMSQSNLRVAISSMELTQPVICEDDAEWP